MADDNIAVEFSFDSIIVLIKSKGPVALQPGPSGCRIACRGVASARAVVAA